MNAQKILLISVALCIVGIGIWFFGLVTKSADEESIPDGAVHTVVLSDEGFSPSELTIKKGDIVVFSTVRSFPFWPASDQHPTHSQYPGFDAKMPIPADGTWSFQFKKEGTWDYHDHLNSTLNAVIYVTQ